MVGVKIGETKLGKTLLRMWFPLVVFSIFMILLIGKMSCMIVFWQISLEWAGLFSSTVHKLVFGYLVHFLFKGL